VTQNVSEENNHSLNGAAVAKTTEPEQEESDRSSPAPETKGKRVSWLGGGRGVLLGLGMGFLLALGGNYLLGDRPAASTQEEPPIAAPAAGSARSITATTVTPSRVNRTLEATGSVAAFEMIPVLSQATGLQIQQVLVDEGEFVKAGQVMARLDDSVLQAELAQAKASMAEAEARLAELRAGTRSEELARARESVRSAQAELDRAKSDLELARKRVQRNQMLATEGAIARDRLDEVLNQERSFRSGVEQAEARLKEAEEQLRELAAGPRPEAIAQAEAQLAQAKAQMQSATARLEDTRVIAPASGKVAERNASVGDVTASSQTLFTVIENGRLELILQVPETELSQIRPGQQVQLASDTDKDLSALGTVREIAPTVDRDSRQAQVKVDLPSESSLKPGMFLRAAIITAADSGTAVPAEAVLPESEGQATVFLVQADNTVKAQVVDMGEPLPGDRVAIESGLSPGDRIAVKGAAYLKDGDKVEVVEDV
jgi:multidrug efflux pump subunit AcrA (membrane-fusion protein)